MKKILFIIAVAALAFVSCEKAPEVVDTLNLAASEVTVPNGFNRAADITIVVTGSADEGEKVLTKIESSSTALGQTTVINQAGNELPETGGMGTKIFYVLGTILFLGAGVVLIARRKASQQ